jgi:hypothetical protein
LNLAVDQAATPRLRLPVNGAGLTLAALHAQLAAPPGKAGIADLLAAFHCVRITAIVSGAGLVAAHPGLLPKLRGALGHALLKGACEGAAHGGCKCHPACAAAALFGPKPKITIGGITQEASKPYVISAARHGGRDLALSVTLFGLASPYAAAARQALGEAVTGGVPWILLGGDVRLSLPASEPALISSSVTIESALESGRAPGCATMDFITGLELNNRDSDALTGHDIFRRLAARASLIAPWCGMDLIQDVDGLRENWDALTVEMDLPEDAAQQPRASSRTGEAWQSRTRLPLVRLTGALEEIWPYLGLGEKTHIGRGAVSGSGRYVLAAGG